MERIIIKKRIVFLLLAIVVLSACVYIPIGENSSNAQSSEIPASDADEPTSDLSHAFAEQSDYGESSEAISSEPDISLESSSETSENDTSSHEVQISFQYNIDITPYLQYIAPENADEYLLLVNYDHRLTEAYAPADLVVTEWTRGDRDGQKLRKTCAMALDAMMREARINGVLNVTVTSGYRSYTYQKWLFNYYVEQYLSRFSSREECERYVMTFSCREGCSEHQTGLAFDMHNLAAADVKFADTPEYAWLEANAHRFGFILRFPKDKEDITGIDFEPWHFRFVGREAATYMYENHLCLEEYCAIFVN